MRALSTVLGAAIALVALLVAMGSAAYYLSEVASVSRSVAHTLSSRLVEQLYMSKSIVVGDEERLCFKPRLPGLIRSIIIVKDKRIVTLRGACVSKAVLLDAKRVVLVSKHGALLPLPDAKLLAGFRGESRLDSLLSGIRGSGDADISASRLTARLTPTTSALVRYTVEYSDVYEDTHYRLKVWEEGRVVTSTLRHNNFTELSSTNAIVKGYVAMWRPTTNILCYHSFIRTDGLLFSMSPTLVNLVLCAKQEHLSSGDIVINGTIAYLDSPVIQKLLDMVSLYGHIRVELGVDKRVYNTDPLAPCRAELDVSRFVIKPTLYDKYMNVILDLPAAVTLALKVFISEAPPLNVPAIRQMVYPVINPYLLPLYTGLALALRKADAGMLVLPIDVFVKRGVVYNVLFSVDAVGLFTYYVVDPSKCRLVRTEPKPIVYLDESLGLGYIPGLVCILGRHKADATGYGYREILDCYYPYKLVCEGDVEIHYNVNPWSVYKQVPPGRIVWDAELIRVVWDMKRMYPQIGEKGIPPIKESILTCQHVLFYLDSKIIKPDASMTSLQGYIREVLGNIYAEIYHAHKYMRGEGAYRWLLGRLKPYLSGELADTLVVVCSNGSIEKLADYLKTYSSFRECNVTAVGLMLKAPNLTFLVTISPVKEGEGVTILPITIPVEGGLASLVVENK